MRALVQEQLDYVGSAEGKRRGAAAMAAPAEALPDLVGGVLTNYEIADRMKDDDVVLELLRLGSIQQETLAVDAVYWLSAAVVAHRAARAAGAAEAAPNATDAANATEVAGALGEVKLLLPSLHTLSASALVSGKDVPPSAYAESNFRKTTVSSLTVPDCTLTLPPFTPVLGPGNGSIVA